MLGNLGKLGSLMKNAKKIQEQMEKAQAELEKLIVTGEAGAGAIKVIMTAKNVVQQVVIDDEILKESKEILQDLIVAAINDANQKAAHEMKSRMMDLEGLAGGNLGDLFGGKE